MVMGQDALEDELGDAAPVLQPDVRKENGGQVGRTRLGRDGRFLADNDPHAADRAGPQPRGLRQLQNHLQLGQGR